MNIDSGSENKKLLEKKKAIFTHFVIENIYYEGEYSKDTGDVGNYHNGLLLGTKHGLSAAFLFSYKPEISVDSFVNMNILDVVEIITEYSFRDYFVNFSETFIFYYVLFIFYYGHHRADFYMSLKYNVPVSKIDSLYYSKEFGYEDAIILRDAFEKLLYTSMRRNPIYANGWRNKYIGLYKRNKHLLNVSPFDSRIINYAGTHKK